MTWRQFLARMIYPEGFRSQPPTVVTLRPEPVAEPEPIKLPSPKYWTDARVTKLAEGKERPYRIYHRSDLVLFFKATDEERQAWNRYVEREVDKFNSNPSLDSYDSVDVYPGWNRDGRQTPWAPPKWFPEWVAERRKS